MKIKDKIDKYLFGEGTALVARFCSKCNDMIGVPRKEKKCPVCGTKLTKGSKDSKGWNETGHMRVAMSR